ncbi:GNAT family N-acetyltransferase [Oryzibacter oryziterrae]|uniref:GNAT family N-acetyltransferase n=1 Tax=Oryzibacter oryziterrae TaxID=2766474 RepID=UPI001F31D020|nr:N-acetyltransferase [Oryzibacter oryziterrae]
MTVVDLTLAKLAQDFALEDVIFRAEVASDHAAIEHIHDVTFGPGRYARTAFRLREGFPTDAATSLVAEFRGQVVGSVRQTKIVIGNSPALLLGPLAVLPEIKSLGLGKSLMRLTMDVARRNNHSLILLVGDLPYYWPFGFRVVQQGKVVMPGPVDPARLLWAELVPGITADVAGAVRAVA